MQTMLLNLDSHYPAKYNASQRFKTNIKNKKSKQVTVRLVASYSQSTIIYLLDDTTLSKTKYHGAQIQVPLLSFQI